MCDYCAIIESNDYENYVGILDTLYFYAGSFLFIMQGPPFTDMGSLPGWGSNDQPNKMCSEITYSCWN